MVITHLAKCETFVSFYQQPDVVLGPESEAS